MHDKFEEWAIIELFGHQRIAGRVSEQQIGGESFIRVDVPETKGQPPFTKLFGKGAIYAMTLTDEKSATAAAIAWAPEPINRWEMDEILRRQKLLSEASDELPFE